MQTSSLTISLFLLVSGIFQMMKGYSFQSDWLRWILVLFFGVMSINKIRNGLFDLLALVFANLFVGLVSVLPTKRAADLRQRRVREAQKRSGASR